MKTAAAIAAKWSGPTVLSALLGVLAGCGGGSDPAPTVSLTVTPVTVALGQGATLAWSASPGASCDASGGWDGPTPATGTTEVTPTSVGTASYTLTCSGDGFDGSAIESVTLTVQPASAYTATSLVEDFAGGAAPTTDVSLVNPWGIAFGPTTGVWVANNRSEIATIYDGNGRPSPLIVVLPPGAGTASFGATGIVFNGTGDFVVSGASQSGSALFIFDGEGGAIAGWAPDLDPAYAFTLYAAPDGAVYKGLALANNGNGNFVYATDFANGKIDVFSATFAKQVPTAATFAFNDPTLPAGYAPFGIRAIENDAAGVTRIYVSYAKHDESDPADEARGAGLGLVNVFDANGNLLTHLVTAGDRLNAPWGMALAPADFGTLSNALLIGNFGDGAIHGYDPNSGRYLGEVSDGGGTPFELPGLWGIAFGNDAANQPHATLFFAAGVNDEVHGRYGRIDLGQTPPALGEPPTVALILPQGDLSGTVTLTADAQSLVAITEVRFFVNGDTLIGAATSEPFSVAWDTTTVGNGSATLRAIATDDNGNVGSSRILTVSVANVIPATTPY